jgi:hypothetical protein
MVLVYLVNKPWVSRRITRWLLLFLEYDFIVVYKPNKTHVVAYVLYDNIKSLGIPKHTTYASYFAQPNWLNDVKMFL